MTDPWRRERCRRCLRPQAMCYCADLPQVATRTRIVILQHPHERTHPFGTVRLARMCLQNASVHVPWAGFTGTLSHPVDVAADAAVLYPHADASDLAELPAAEFPSTLIAIDGTWAHAKRLYRENTWLHGLRHVRLQPASPSRYRIRREPRPDYISTLEAIVEALRIVEPETHGLDDLLAAFDAMIDRQLAHRAVTPRQSRLRRPRLKTAQAISPLLADPRLVVVYAEAALPGGDPAATRELVQWVAARVDDNETFEAFLQPSADGPSADHLQHMGLAGDLLTNGETTAAAAERFAAWLGTGSPLAAWTGSTFDWGSYMVPVGSEHTMLKVSYCNAAQRRAGYLDQVVRREGLQPVANTCHGRAGDRLANAIAVARWLRDRLPAV